MKLLEECKQAKRIGISGHIRPDGDCIGSCMGPVSYTHLDVYKRQDSTSAVDTATEAKIREGMAKSLPGTTKIIIAQRISLSLIHI